MWECPQCGRNFINRNQHHGCLLYEVERHFERGDPLCRQVFDRACEILDGLGPYTILGQKTWIAFQGRALFFFLKPRVRGADVTLVLPGAVTSSRILRVDEFSSSKKLYRLTLQSMDDFDAECEAWLRQAFYECG